MSLLCTYFTPLYSAPEHAELKIVNTAVCKATQFSLALDSALIGLCDETVHEFVQTCATRKSVLDHVSL